MNNAQNQAPSEGDPTPALDPHELPYPGHAREMAAIQAKAAAAARTRGEPLPGPLRAAFAGEPRRLHGFTFQPVCEWLIAILRRIESPILDLVKIYQAHSAELTEAQQIVDPAERQSAMARINRLIAAEQQAIQLKPDAAMETAFAFVTEVEKVQDLLDAGRKEYTMASRKLLGKLHPNQLADLERACGEHFAESFTAALNIRAVRKDDPNETVFTPPPAMMASAGGSKSSAP